MNSSNNHGDVKPDTQTSTAEGGYLVLEGPLSELHVEPGRQNLLAKIDPHYRGRSAAIAVGAAALDQFGLAASAANLASYDGESTHSFACLVGDKLVYGQFSGAQFLKVGNTVKAVVSRRGEGYLAHAILDRKQGYLWTNIAEGSRADTKFHLRLATWSFGGISAFTAVFALLSDGVSRDSLNFILFVVLIAFILVVIVFFWSHRDGKKLADPATEVFRALGFDHPEDVSFIGFNAYLLDFKERTAMDRDDGKFAKTSLEECRDLINYREAIRKHKVRFVDGNDPHRQLEGAMTVVKRNLRASRPW